MESSNYPKVHVYRNLTRNCWSVKSVKTGIVIFHAESLTLENVTPHVNEAGRKRVIANNRKEVHAWLTGNLVAASQTSFANTRDWFNEFDKLNELDAVSCRQFEREYQTKIKIWHNPENEVTYKPVETGHFMLTHYNGEKKTTMSWKSTDAHAKHVVFAPIVNGERPRIYAVFE